MTEAKNPRNKPGICIPFDEKKMEYAGGIPGDEELVKKVHEDIDTLAYLYVWFCLISY